MKKIIMMAIILSGILFSQTRWIDAGTTNSTGVNINLVTFEGVIDGFDTLYSKPFMLNNTDPEVTCWYFLTQENDSIKITAEKEVAGIDSCWVRVKPLFEDSIATPNYTLDTLGVIPLRYRLRVRAIYGNGRNANFKISINANKK